MLGSLRSTVGSTARSLVHQSVSRSTPFGVQHALQTGHQRRQFSDDVVSILEGLKPEGPPQAGSAGYPAPKHNLQKNALFNNSTNPNSPNPEDELYVLQHTRLRLHCHSSPNNTIATLTRGDGSTIAWFSGGSCGFKKGNRATYEAGYQCAVRAFKKIDEIHKKEGSVKVDLFFKGFGQGREALKGALLATEGEPIRPLIATITDRTPIKIGGTRSKKMQRN